MSGQPRTTVAVVGAGPVGGATAHRLATTDGVREIRLVDAAYKIAAGTALDILQAGPVENSDVDVTAHRDLHSVVGATVILVADPVGSADTERGDREGLDTLRKLADLNPRAVIICVGASHHQLIERAVSADVVSGKRLIGSAPAAFASALRAVVAVELRCSPRDVSLSVLGVPPTRLVIPWGVASARGVPLSELLDPPRFSRLKQKVERLWPPEPYTLAAAAAYLTKTLLLGFVERSCPSFVVLDGELGIRRRAAAVNITLSSRGVARVLEPSLTPQERVQLTRALHE